MYSSLKIPFFKFFFCFLVLVIFGSGTEKGGDQSVRVSDIGEGVGGTKKIFSKRAQ